MKIKKIIAALMAGILLSGCAGNTETSSESSSTESYAPPASTTEHTPEPDPLPETTTLTDMVGREVTVKPGTYKRVVCIGAGALRMYSYIGDISLLCGIEDIDNTTLSDRPKMFDSSPRPYILAYGEQLAQLPSCGVGGPNAQTAEAEKILSCAPDIVISEYEDADKENALQEQLGVPVITLRSGPDGVFSDFFRESLKMLGIIFDKRERAEELLSYISDETAEIFSRTSGIAPTEKPTVYICGLGNWGTTNHLWTAQNYKPFEIANVKNIITDLPANGIQAIDEEKFASISKDIDIMMIDSAAVKNIKPLYNEDKKLFDGVKAQKNGNVYLQMAYNSYYTNYELALANTWFIAKTVYPEIFSDIDLEKKTDEITEKFLGKGLAKEIFSCPASFGGYQKIDVPTFFGD